MGDFNIDIKKANSTAYDKMEKLCDTFNLENLVKPEIRFMDNHKSTIDLVLTNKSKSFQITNVTGTGVSDGHKLITTFMKSYISCLKLRKVQYCSYKNFNEEKLLSDVKEAIFPFEKSNPDENYLVLTSAFSNIVNIHALLKKKIIRENDAPFMNKGLRKAFILGGGSEIGTLKTLTKRLKRPIKTTK